MAETMPHAADETPPTNAANNPMHHVIIKGDPMIDRTVI